MNQAEARVLPVTLVLLLLAFGSVVAALLPLGVGVLAIAMTMGACALLANYLHLSILVQNLATMVGLGLGIDYALLMVNRFREALADGHQAGDAADLAASQVGKTLVISPATVAIGFAALLWVPISELRSIGVAGLLVAAMSVLLCTLILPYLLGVLGTRINAGRIVWLRTQRAGTETWWRRWGMAVTARPWTTVRVAGAPLLLLAWQAQRIEPGLPPGDWLPPSAESVQALHTLDQMDRAGIVQSFRIILELPANEAPASEAGWAAVSRLTSYLMHDARAQQVISLQTITDMAASSAAITYVPALTRRNFLRSDGRATLIEVLPSHALTPTGQTHWVDELRHADIAAITGIAGAALRVGGLPALNADFDKTVHQHLPGAMNGVVGGSVVALLLGLRSVFAAMKAIALNLLSVGAAFGALVLVFQEGHGSRLLGVAGATGHVFTIIPILSFAIVFGLSMDYEIFLVSRILEERPRGLSERAAIVAGLAPGG